MSLHITRLVLELSELSVPLRDGLGDLGESHLDRGDLLGLCVGVPNGLVDALIEGENLFRGLTKGVRSHPAAGKAREQQYVGNFVMDGDSMARGRAGGLGNI